jgi:hypothetical protein
MPVAKNRRSKRNKSRNKRMTFRKRKYTKRRHYRGGNFGGHCPDPFNYSIYNSNMLKLFPYRA